MTQTRLETASAGARELGLVGARQLHAVQLIDIGRLTAHVVPFVPGTFVAVSGRGPKGDSNESGKTTFLAATSLLLGDAEWKLRSGGQHATTLLFNPEAVGAAAHLADAAEHGYVVGLFALPGEPPRDPLSIWLRINRATPYLEIKACYGEAFVDPAGDIPSQLAADSSWSTLPNIAGSRPLGAGSFVEALYGSAPRCIAHLTKRGDLPSGVSLLNTNAGSFSRTQIGSALVALAARQDILDDDRASRASLDQSDHDLAELRAGQERREREYQEQLASLDGRDRARQLLGDARRDWETHDARRYLDLFEERQAKLTELSDAKAKTAGLTKAVEAAEARLAGFTDVAKAKETHAEAARLLAEAEQRLDEALERQAGLASSVEAARSALRNAEATASGWSGAGPEETERLEQEARDALAQAQREAAIAESAVEAARKDLERAYAGRSDAQIVLTALEEAGIAAVGLLDSVTCSDRAVEPLLWPYRDAVVVAPEDLEQALRALSTTPWAMIVSGDEDLEQPSLAEAPPAARGFLARLAARATAATDPERAIDEELGLTVIAGDEALAGRSARVRAAQKRVAEAEARSSELAAARSEAALTSEARADDHRRASAAAQASELVLTLKERETELDEARTRRAKLGGARDVARERERELEIQLRAFGAARDAALAEAERAKKELVSEKELIQLVTDAVVSLDDQLAQAARAWPQGVDGARARCAEDGRDEGRLRNAANDALTEALYALGMRRDLDEAPTDELLEAWRKRREDENTTPFPVLAGPLGAYLDEHSDRDLVLRERLEEEREKRAEALDGAELEANQWRNAVSRTEDAVEASIEAALTAIEAQFDRLDREAGGFGAKLEIEVTPPASLTDTWRFSVTPMWRRSPDGRMVPYTAPTNSAQDKLYTVNLVLAALLSVPNPEGRILILDELGDSLGHEHRREVLRAIAATAQAKEVTVLGTCQDDVLHDAADFTQEIVFFEYPDNRELLNRPVRLFGYDPQGSRIELTREAVLRGRPVV
jgi:chromosome segregation protein